MDEETKERSQQKQDLHRLLAQIELDIHADQSVPEETDTRARALTGLPSAATAAKDVEEARPAGDARSTVSGQSRSIGTCSQRKLNARCAIKKISAHEGFFSRNCA